MHRKYIHVPSLTVPRSTKASAFAPVSDDAAHKIIVQAWENGRLHVTAHFKMRGQQRGFDLLDVENVVRDGRMHGLGEFCPDYGNWKYRFRGNVEDKKLEVVVSLDPTEEYASPLVIVLTGYWR